MKRPFSFAFTVGAFGLLGLIFVACDSSHDDDYGGGGGPYGCNQYTSCNQCTPVQGCGWCQTPSGEGLCTADPNDCASAQTFTWTWSPQGCFVPADASVVPQPLPRDDAGSSANPQADAGPRTDAAQGVDGSDGSSLFDAAPGVDAADAADAAGE